MPLSKVGKGTFCVYDERIPDLEKRLTAFL